MGRQGVGPHSRGLGRAPMSSELSSGLGVRPGAGRVRELRVGCLVCILPVSLVACVCGKKSNFSGPRRPSVEGDGQRPAHRASLSVRPEVAEMARHALPGGYERPLPPAPLAHPACARRTPVCARSVLVLRTQ